MPSLLLALLLLLLPPSGTGTATLSGKIEIAKGGVARSDASSAVVWIEGLRSGGASRGGVRGEMQSAKKTFTPRVVAVPAESGVEFPNSDPIFHNVFSVSGGNRFDLGLYRSGTSKTKRFGEPGLVRVYCNIHPQMVGFVMVVDSDFFAVTGREGTFRFEAVPPGSYVVKAWHEETGETQVPVAIRAGEVSSVTLKLDASGFRPAPHKNKYGKDYPPQAGLDDERY